MFSDDGILKDGLYESFDDFRQKILNLSEYRPKYLRKGQYIYSYCAGKYTEYVKHLYNNVGDDVDCFYKDENIDKFLKFIYDSIIYDKFINKEI
jgi:hypothetical protein